VKYLPDYTSTNPVKYYISLSVYVFPEFKKPDFKPIHNSGLFVKNIKPLNIH
jgi:hypothetical protein